MKKAKSLLLLLLAFLAACCSCSTVPDECGETGGDKGQEQAKFQEAFAAMQARQNRVRSIRATWTGVGLAYWAGDPEGELPNLKWNPVKVQRRIEPTLWIKESQLRYEGPGMRCLCTPEGVILEDTGWPEAAGDTDGPNWKDIHMSFSEDAYLPVTLAYRPVDRTIGPISSTPWKPVKKETYENHPCVVVRGTPFPMTSREPSYRVWLAKDRDYLPVHYEVRDEFAEQGSMDYVRRNGEWVLDGWIRRIPGRAPGMEWWTARKATSVDIKLNADVSDKHFPHIGDGNWPDIGSEK